MADIKKTNKNLKFSLKDSLLTSLELKYFDNTMNFYLKFKGLEKKLQKLTFQTLFCIIQDCQN